MTENGNGVPKLGDRVRDKISGFTGIADSMHLYLNGCVRVMISPEALHDGKPISPQIFDISQTEVVEAGVFPPIMEGVTSPEHTMRIGPGGSRDDPPSREAPSR